MIGKMMMHVGGANLRYSFLTENLQRWMGGSITDRAYRRNVVRML